METDFGPQNSGYNRERRECGKREACVQPKEEDATQFSAPAACWVLVIYCINIQSSVWAFQVAIVVKNSPANEGDIRDTGSIPGLGRSPGGGCDNPLRYSCLENSRDTEAWRATVHRVTKSQTRLKRLSMYACIAVCIWNFLIFKITVSSSRFTMFSGSKKPQKHTQSWNLACGPQWSAAVSPSGEGTTLPGCAAPRRSSLTWKSCSQWSELAL